MEGFSEKENVIYHMTCVSVGDGFSAKFWSNIWWWSNILVMDLVLKFLKLFSSLKILWLNILIWKGLGVIAI